MATADRSHSLSKVLKKAHKAKRLTVQLDPPRLDKPTSRPTHAHCKPKPGPASCGRIPPPASAPRPSTRQSQKPAPTTNAPCSSAKFSKAQVKQLCRNGSSGRQSLATNQNSTGDRRNTPTTSKPADPPHACPPNVPKPAHHANVSQVTTANAPTHASLSPGPPNCKRVGTPDVLPTTNAETEEAPATELKKTTKKAMVQLRFFGEARPIVELVVEWIKVKMIVTCPFPELLPSEDEADSDAGSDSPPPCKTLFDDWVDKFWDRAHAKIRRGKSAIDHKETHEYYFRNHVKGTCFGKISPSYQITRGNPQDVNRALDLINNNKFLSPHLVNDTHWFKHEIISKTIQEAFFDGPKDLRSKYKA
ncbi:hypothetical protein FS749_004468 [Ceratobasidium sp. UAMH 11750]|nr:hypothetical protein FS749_004468 [Ceratobasidium sp. UAMH 11750]